MIKSLNPALLSVAMLGLVAPLGFAQGDEVEPQKPQKEVVWVMTYNNGGG